MQQQNWVVLSPELYVKPFFFLPLGQPYNQLAILASSKGDHLTTIFYYCRSIAVKFPFPAASTNLQKALSKALERYVLCIEWPFINFLCMCLCVGWGVRLIVEVFLPVTILICDNTRVTI